CTDLGPQGISEEEEQECSPGQLLDDLDIDLDSAAAASALELESRGAAAPGAGASATEYRVSGLLASALSHAVHAVVAEKQQVESATRSTETGVETGTLLTRVHQPLLLATPRTGGNTPALASPPRYTMDRVPQHFDISGRPHGQKVLRGLRGEPVVVSSDEAVQSSRVSYPRGFSAPISVKADTRSG
ncbi:unnamed protein product, partial [Amoebophrya sp. A25]